MGWIARVTGRQTRQRESRYPRLHDRIALGLVRRALRPIPHGTDELGRTFIDAHGGDVPAAIGDLLARVTQLEGWAE